jgi:hypothetical protein
MECSVPERMKEVSTSHSPWPLWECEGLLGVLTLPWRVLYDCYWYLRHAQAVYALRFDGQSILMRPRQLPWALWGLLTCWCRTLPDVHLLGKHSTSLVAWGEPHAFRSLGLRTIVASSASPYRFLSSGGPRSAPLERIAVETFPHAVIFMV